MEQFLPKMSTKLRIEILLFDAFSNMVLAALMEPLRVVRDETGAEIEWAISTPHNKPVISSSGLELKPHAALKRTRNSDILIVVGGDCFRSDAEDPAVKRMLTRARHASVVIAADTGTWLLASAGYLTGKRVTLHWQLINEFSAEFPDITVVDEALAVDGRWLTCGSAAGAMDLVLREIEKHFGAIARFSAASMFMNSPRIAGDNRNEWGGIVPHSNPGVNRVLALMAAHVEVPHALPDIARDAGMTLRTMARLFETELGMTPGKCYQSIRLARAREMLAQQRMTTTDVAHLCGYSCAASLKRALSRFAR